ncbi:MAG: hemolysin family protein [Treponemataceae bacterium]|nr:hemolysin family protein [Treponemataceae bacterium]
MRTALYIFALVLMIVLAAFFASSETAFLSISKIRMRQLRKEKDRKTKLLVRLKDDQSKLLTTILIGTNLANNAASSIAAALAISLMGQEGIAISTILMTLVVVTFGEIFPKSAAAESPEKTALKAAPKLRAVEIILSPVVKFFNAINKGFIKLIHAIWKDDTPAITEDELKMLIEVGREEGTLESAEKELLTRIFEFTDLRVRDIYTHRSFIKAVPLDATYKETVDVISSSGFSRIPVYKENQDNIVGILHYKDVLYLNGNETDFSVKRIMRPVLFVPETVLVETLLTQFRKSRKNFAVVIAEQGDMIGIVTMDDVMQAVFGHITDEYNATNLLPEERIRITENREFIVPGDMLTSDVNNFLGQNFVSEEFETIGGWLLEQFGYLPEPGEKINRASMVFVVASCENRRIHSIRMRYERDASQML